MNYSTAKSIVQKMRKSGNLLRKQKSGKVELFKVVKEADKNQIILTEEEKNEKFLEKKLIEIDSQKIGEKIKFKPIKKNNKKFFPKKIFNLDNKNVKNISKEELEQEQDSTKILAEDLLSTGIITKNLFKPIKIKNKIIIGPDGYSAFDNTTVETNEFSMFKKIHKQYNLMNEFYDDFVMLYKRMSNTLQEVISEVELKDIIKNNFENLIEFAKEKGILKDFFGWFSS